MLEGIFLGKHKKICTAVFDEPEAFLVHPVISQTEFTISADKSSG
jgi:hypothetical protein